ncbi:MAG: hypothetical protein AAFQ09_10820 [Pseudomonadota bacterium]
MTGLSASALSTPFLILPSAASANPLLFWVGRRIATGFATRSIRRRVVGMTFLTSSGSMAQASSDLLNGAIRDGIVNPAYDSIFDPKYSPRVQRTENGAEVIYPKPSVSSYRNLPPREAAMATVDEEDKVVAALSNFFGVFDMSVDPAQIMRNTYRSIVAEDIDTEERYVTGQKIFITSRRAETGNISFEANLGLPVGRYVLKFANSLDDPMSCVIDGRCLEGVSEPFYVDRV